MGLFTKKKTQQEQMLERLESMTAGEQKTLSNFYSLEMAQEDIITKKIENPPSGIWKKNRYKERKRTELAELKDKHNELFDRDGMAKAQLISNNMQQKLDRIKGNKELVSIEEIESLFDYKQRNGGLYDAKKLLWVEEWLPPTDNYKRYKDALAMCKADQKPDLDEQTKESVKTSLKAILGTNVDLDVAMGFVGSKHALLQKLLYYRALLESMDKELAIMLGQPGVDFAGLSRSEYARLYGERLVADAMVARVLLQQKSLLQEYQEYQQAQNSNIVHVDEKEDEDFVINDYKEEVNIDIHADIEKEKDIEIIENPIELKVEVEEVVSPYQALYNKITDVGVSDIYVPSECTKSYELLGIYNRLKNYLELKSENPNANVDITWNLIRQGIYKNRIHRKMGPLSDILTFSLPLIKKETIGKDFLENEDKLLFIEYAVLAVAEALCQAFKDEADKTTEIGENDVRVLEAKTEELKQKLGLDEVNKDRIKKVKDDFKTVRKAAIEESWQKYPECFAYYQFMNDEVVKSNDHIAGKRKEKGLFEKKDFDVFDSNDPQVLKGYLKVYKEQYMSDKNHNPMYDEIYEYLEKHINFRVQAQKNLKKIAQNGPVAKYKKTKTWEVDEKEDKYMLKGFETTQQNTGQGCWSVALAAMLQYRGFNLNQRDIRSHRFEANTDINYNSSYYQNMNQALNIADHANLLVEIAPDAMMKQVSFQVLPDNAILKTKIKDMVKEAIGKSHGPIALLYNGHYRIIYGCHGEEVTMHDPLKTAAGTLSLDKLINDMSNAMDVSFYWLEDLPKLNEQQERVIEVKKEDIDIRYTKEGVLEYRGEDEYEDPGLSIVRNGYAQLYTGGVDKEYLEYNYVFLPAAQKRRVDKA